MPGLKPAELADLLVDHQLALRSDRDAAALAAAEEESRMPLVDKARRLLALYVDRIVSH